MPEIKLSLKTHAASWTGCKKCHLCEGRKQVVIGRGTLPCDVLFIGEAPGESEDVVGKPFVGPAGKLLDHIIVTALGPLRTYAITNLVGCIPRDPESRDKAIEPDDEYIKACAPKLREFYALARPKIVVRVGKLAQTWVDPVYKHSSIRELGGAAVADIVHPAAILRANITARGIMVQRAIVTIKTAIDSLPAGG